MADHDQFKVPPPRPPGSRADLRRRALAAAAAATTLGAAAPEQEAPPRDSALPLPLPWTCYFDGQERVRCPERQAEFNVYTAGSAGPVVMCLHGGGYTGLSWSLIAAALKDRHRIVAPDLRCHGLTTAADEVDFSADTLAADVVALWQAMFAGGGGGQAFAVGVGAEPSAALQGQAGLLDGQRAGQEGAQQRRRQQQQQRGDTKPPPTVLVGHSMGGAVAVHAAALAGIASLAGVVVIDVVEGTALASLPYMAGVLAKRPRRFATLRQAVDWALDSGMCKRQEAAHISLPAMLRPESPDSSSGGGGGGSAASAQHLAATGLEPLMEEEEGEAGSEALDEGLAGLRGHSPDLVAEAGPQQHGVLPASLASDSSAPSGGSACGGLPTSDGGGGGGGGWVWRTPLERSAPFWEGWYTGLSDLFLKLPVPKVLVLVGTDRLDRPLTIGQMQGKFQPVLLPQAGHAVHEDEPERTAEAIATFIRRFRIGEPPLQIPRPAPGIRPVLPVAMGPAFQWPQQAPQQHASLQPAQPPSPQWQAQQQAQPLQQQQHSEP